MPLKHLSSNLHLQNITAQKNLRKTWKVSYLVSPLKIIFLLLKKKNLLGLWCYILLYTARVSEEAAAWRNSIDPANICKARRNSKWQNISVWTDAIEEFILNHSKANIFYAYNCCSEFMVAFCWCA